MKGKSTESKSSSYELIIDNGDAGLYTFVGFSTYNDSKAWVKNNKCKNISETLSGGSKRNYDIAETSNLYKKYDDKYYKVYYGYSSDSYGCLAYSTKEDLSSFTIYCSQPSNTTKFALPETFRLVETSTTSWDPMYSALGTSSTISATFDGFVIPSGATITKQTADCTSYSEESGAATFDSATTTSTVSATRSDDGSTITISGFDFSGNFCGGPDGDNNYMGNKLIVTFPVATTVSNTGGSAKTVVNTVTVTNQNIQQVTGFTSSTATVNLPNLTIQVSGVNANDNCIFTVSGTAGSSWNKTFTVMTHGTTPVKLQALPAGTYTITPKSWPWTYNLPDPKNNVTLSGAESTETFTFTPKTITTPHHGEASANTPAN